MWLPAALVLGIVIAYVAPAIAWRTRGARAAHSAGRGAPFFGLRGPFWQWVVPLSLAGVGGLLVARGDAVAGAILIAAGLAIRVATGTARRPRSG